MIERASVFSLSEAEMERIERRFEEKRRMAQARERELFGVFAEPGLTEEERWALMHLYACMPVNDMADYDGALFLSHVRRTLNIRRKVPWGGRVPDALFLSFVLPYRVNTENIEDSRGLLYDELAERTKHLSMADAILETNYWCHEKATYIGSDLRTASPLTMIRTARGRCGEESTLAVAALRSIGIPARQVYTPRWAHCDDNHAWVEAWADGAWYYIGACEPEPRLNEGWFGPPARRAMLIHTRVFTAAYPGPEGVTATGEGFAELNLLEGYAPTRSVAVRVLDERGNPAAGAEVRFELYNYAELFPIAVVTADERGEASLKTGYGGLRVRAVRDGKWGEASVPAAGESGDVRFESELALDRTEQPEGVDEWDMVPPPEREGEPTEPLSEEALERHRRRVEEGTRIRTAYEETFPDEEEAFELASELGLPPERVEAVLRKARGNARELAAFLRERSGEYGEWPLRLLESLREKDLTDTFRETLDDHLIGSLALRGELADELFVPYVLCPRVQDEMLVPYKRLLGESFGAAEAAAFREEPAALAGRLTEGFELRQDLPNLIGKGNPVGTFRLRKGDPVSMAILFVAVCRSLGVPARLHPSERMPQYWADGGWKEALLPGAAGQREAAAEWGRLRLLRDESASPDAPEASYGESFTFARLENGVYRTLSYPHGKKDVYDEPFEAEAGAYRLTTGVRLKDGTVHARFAYFNVAAGEETRAALVFRQSADGLPVLGALDRAHPLASPDGAVLTLGERIGADGALAAWLEPEREPTQHLLRELGELTQPLASLGAPIVLVVRDAGRQAPLDPAVLAKLPPNAVLVRDAADAALPDWMERPAAREAGFPHLFALDGAARIRYASSGYKIGAGKEALQALAGVRRESADAASHAAAEGGEAE